MFNFKEEIAKKVANAVNVDYTEIIKGIEVPKEKNMGNYAFPCFRLAKILKKSPQSIAEEIKNNLDMSGNAIEKTEVVSRIS